MFQEIFPKDPLAEMGVKNFKIGRGSQRQTDDGKSNKMHNILSN